MSDEKMDLIAKLLAKAESTTPEEAEALTEHAERLMVKYGIEQAVIDERRAKLGQSQEKIIESKTIYTGVYAKDKLELAAQVAFGLGNVRPLQSKTWAGELQAHIVGFESDVRQAEILIASLDVQAAVAMRAWWKEQRGQFSWMTEHEKRNIRSGFLRGFALGARRRIADSRKKIVEESGSGTELVLASRLDRVDATIGKVGKARKRAEANSWAHANGDLAGQQANTGEKSLENRKELGA